MDKLEPRTFKDNEARTWVVAITSADLKRVRLQTGIKLDALISDGLKPLHALLSDVEQFVDVLYLLCQSQAEKLNVSPEDFGRAMVGDYIDEAGQTFVRALADFSPSRIRTALLDLATKGTIAAKRIEARASAELEKLTPEMIEEAIEKMIAEKLTPKSSVINSPDSAELILTPAVFAN